MIPLLKGFHHTAEEVGQATKEKKLLYLFLSYNDECNMSCPGCFSSEGIETKNQLSSKSMCTVPLQPHELRRIISEAKELGVESISLWGEGEPLLDKELFFELTTYIRKEGMIPILYTNGTLIDKEAAERLFTEGISVVGKIESLNPEINEKLTGNGGLYEYTELGGASVPKYISLLLDEGFRGTNRLGLGTVLTPHNSSGIKDLWKWERKLSIIPYVQFLTYSGKGKNRPDMDLNLERRRKLSIELHKIDQELGINYPLIFSHYLGPNVCCLPPRMVVGLYGNGRLCTCIYEFVGNVRKKTLKEIFEAKLEREQELRFENKEPLYCDAYVFNKSIE